MTVGELEQRMGASELEEWKLLWASDPWGPYRDNFHAALITSVLVNIHRKKNTKPIDYTEFMLSDREQYQRKKSKEFLSWMKAVGKKVNRGE